MANEITKTNLDKYLYQLRRIEEHRTKGAEKEIRKIYKDIMKELQSYLADVYMTYSEDDMLNYALLFAAGQDARFLEEVEQRINGISPQVSSVIKDTVSQTYEACYNGLNNAVVKAAGNTEVLTKALQTVKACTPEVVRQAVNNPIAGLTLNDRLEKNRKEIIYDIKQNIGVGLTNGDRYSTMAKRISESVEGDYNKAIRIVRTETHRVREAGMLDAAQECNTALKNGKSGKVLAKTWRTMQDERVRPNKQKGKGKLYNHVKMDGVSVLVDEEFTLPSGAKGKAPSQTGVAGEDINCRCYLSYDLVPAEQVTGNGTGETPEGKEPDAGQPKKYKDVNEAYGKVNLNGIDKEFKEEIESELLRLANDYPIHTQEITIKTNTSRSEFGHATCGIRGSKRQGGYYGVSDIHIAYNKSYHKTGEISQKYHEKDYGIRGSKLAKSATAKRGTISHEYAHQIDNYYLFKKKPELLEGVLAFKQAQPISFADVAVINSLNREIHNSNNKLSSVIFQRMATELNLNDVKMYKEIRANYGTYAGVNKGEFLAEGFSNMLNIDDKNKTDFMRLFEKIFNEEFDKVIRE